MKGLVQVAAWNDSFNHGNGIKIAWWSDAGAMVGTKPWRRCPMPLQALLRAAQCVPSAFVLLMGNRIVLCRQTRHAADTDVVMARLWECVHAAAAQVSGYCIVPRVEPIHPDRAWLRARRPVSVVCGTSAAPLVATYVDTRATVLARWERFAMWRTLGFEDVRAYTATATNAVAVIVDDADYLLEKTGASVVPDAPCVWLLRAAAAPPSELVAWVRYDPWRTPEFERECWRVTCPRRLHAHTQHVTVTPDFQPCQWLVTDEPIPPRDVPCRLVDPKGDVPQCSVCMCKDATVAMAQCCHSLCYDCFLKCSRQDPRCPFCRAPHCYNIVRTITVTDVRVPDFDGCVLVDTAARIPPCVAEWARGRGCHCVDDVWGARAVLVQGRVSRWLVADGDVPPWLHDLLCGQYTGAVLEDGDSDASDQNHD